MLSEQPPSEDMPPDIQEQLKSLLRSGEEVKWTGRGSITTHLALLLLPLLLVLLVGAVVASGDIIPAVASIIVAIAAGIYILQAMRAREPVFYAVTDTRVIQFGRLLIRFQSSIYSTDMRFAIYEEYYLPPAGRGNVILNIKSSGRSKRKMGIFGVFNAEQLAVLMQEMYQLPDHDTRGFFEKLW